MNLYRKLRSRLLVVAAMLAMGAVMQSVQPSLPAAAGKRGGRSHPLSHL